MENEKKGIAGFLGLNKATKIGSYTVCVSAIVLALLIVVNLLVGILPTSVTKLDTSDNKLYTLSGTTKKFVSAIDDDVTIWVLCEGGKLGTTMETFLGRYTGLTSHLRIEVVDPLKDPSIFEKFNGTSGLSNYSMIIESARRWTQIDYNSLDYYYVQGAGSLDAATYQQLISNDYYVQYYAYAYGIDLTAATHYFGGEQALTRALEYVTLKSIPHLYILTGSGEAALGEGMTSLMEQAAMEYESLNLLSVGSVPADASAVLINAPSSDLSETEAAALKEYLAAGGNMILISAPGCEKMPRLLSLMDAYGVSTTGEMVYEGNANRYKNSPHILFPLINSKHDITATLVSYNATMFMPQAHGISVAETLPESVSCTKLFVTSDAAYVKTADGAEKDIGETALGVALENSTTGSRVVWLGSSVAFNDASLQTYGSGAVYYLSMAISWENKTYTSSISAIEAVNMEEGTLNVSSFGTILWFVVMVVLVPLILLVTGIVIWVRRRRR